MKKTQNTERETIAMLVVVQNLGVRRIIPTSENIMGRRRENVMRTIKLICMIICTDNNIITNFRISINRHGNFS